MSLKEEKLSKYEYCQLPVLIACPLWLPSTEGILVYVRGGSVQISRAETWTSSFCSSLSNPLMLSFCFQRRRFFLFFPPFLGHRVSPSPAEFSQCHTVLSSPPAGQCGQCGQWQGQRSCTKWIQVKDEVMPFGEPEGKKLLQIAPLKWDQTLRHVLLSGFEVHSAWAGLEPLNQRLLIPIKHPEVSAPLPSGDLHMCWIPWV